MRPSRGTALIVAGIVLVSSTVLVSAATAPARDVQRASVGNGSSDGGTSGVLVGSQGGGQNWQKKGSVYRLDGHDVQWKINDRDSYFDATRLPNGSVVAGFLHNG